MITCEKSSEARSKSACEDLRINELSKVLRKLQDRDNVGGRCARGYGRIRARPAVVRKTHQVVETSLGAFGFYHCCAGHRGNSLLRR